MCYHEHVRSFPLSSLSRNLRRRVAAVAATASFLGVLLGSVAAGCGDSSKDETSGRRVSLRFKTQATPESGTAFVNAYGWSIQLSRALLSVGSQYFFEGEPNLTVHSVPMSPAPRTTFLRIGIREAQAHPGHYDPGAAMGEVLDPGSSDLLGGLAELAVGSGVSGWYRSARFTFGSPATGAFKDALGDYVAVVEGSAAKNGAVLQFVATAKRDQVLATDTERPVVDGCAFGPVDVESDGVVTLKIDVRVWVDQIPFDQVNVPAVGTTAPLEPGSVPHKAFIRGLQKTDGYVYEISQ